MKRKLLFAIAGLTSLSVMGQSTSIPNMNGPNVAKPYTKNLVTGFENKPGQLPNSAPRAVAASLNGTTIGTTSYDLQSNACVQNRLVLHADGTVSAVWTYSNTYDLAASDRGTGYNYMDGTGWGPAPTSRIESERGGWPSILGVAGGEVNTLHNTTSGVITMNKRATKGSGSWTETNVTSTPEIIWNRTAVGGPNNQTIHMVGVTAPTANGGTLYQGLDGALVYYRSLDGGVTWDQNAVVLPGMTSNEFTGFSGDSYSIMARGNTVILAVFNGWADSFIMKSTDNGLTWTKKVFVDFPFTKYVTDQAGGSDVDGDGVADTITTTDNTGSLVIDHMGNAHVFYGNMRVLDADLTDGNSSYFPYTNGLLYWNEKMDADSAEFIAWAEDFDGDGVAANGNETDISLYFASLAGFPNASIDANGSIYVTYSAYMENKDNGLQSYRHVYLVKSDDGGCTWNQFEDMTPNDDFAECMFASIATSVDDSIRFIYQEDIEPGLAVRGDEDAFDLNNIVYISVAKSSLNNTVNSCVTWVDGNKEFCFGDTVAFTANCGTAYAWSSGSNINVEEITTHGSYSVDITTQCGTTVTENFTTIAPTTTPVVTPTGNLFVCNSGTAQIGVQPVSLGSYQWSTGDTTNTITINAPGDYYITVSNCAGATVDTLSVVTEPTPSNQVNVIGNTEICEGSGSIVLSAQEGSSWLWSNGDTTQSITISTMAQTGSYTCEISNTCGDMVTSSAVSVTVNETPAKPTVIYTGNGIYESSATTGNQWYLDGVMVSGATNQTFFAGNSVNSTVSVTTTNANGCTSEASDDMVVSVENLILNNAVKLYPNPTNGVFTLDVSKIQNENFNISITNITGQVVYTKNNIHSSTPVEINLENQSKGVYFIEVAGAMGTTTFKIVVE